MKCEACASKGVSVNMEKCENCGLVFCFNCDGQSNYGEITCPECGSDTGKYQDGIANSAGESDPFPRFG